MNINNCLPKVTVITPAFNRASFLDETVISVLSQDYPCIEYIVLDDGSTDNTQDVLSYYSEKVQIVFHENIGETRTVNKGFFLATGQIIGVVNSDDPLLPGAIRRIVDVMLARPDVIVAYPDWYMVDGNGDIVREMHTYEYSYTDMLRWHHCVPGPGTFFRRSVIDDIGGRDPAFRYVGDFDFWLHAGLLGPFVRIPECLATFRVHEKSASVSEQNLIMGKEHMLLVNKLFSISTLPKEICKIKREAFSSASYIAGVVCGHSSLWTKLKYFFMALYYSPFKYFGEYRVRLKNMLSSIMSCVKSTKYFNRRER